MDNNSRIPSQVSREVGATQSVQNPVMSSFPEGQSTRQQQNNLGFDGIQHAPSSSDNVCSLSLPALFDCSFLTDDDHDGFPRSAPRASRMDSLERQLSALNLDPSTCLVPNNARPKNRVSSNDINGTDYSTELQRTRQIWNSANPRRTSFFSKGYEPGESSLGSYNNRSDSFDVHGYAQKDSSYMASTSNRCNSFDVQLIRNHPSIFHSSRNSNSALRNFSSGDIGQSQLFPHLQNSLRDLRGMIPSAAKRLTFSQFWKNAFEVSTQEEIDMVFSELIDHIGYFCCHTSAIHVVQKLIERCRDQQRTEILVVFKNNFLELCVDENGTHAVKELAEFLTLSHQFGLFVRIMCSVLVQLIESVHGIDVIRVCMNRFPPRYVHVILKEASAHTLHMAMHQNGCFLLQDFIKRCPVELKEKFIPNITRNAVELSSHHYGNYAVQCVLDLGNYGFTEEIVLELRGYYAFLSYSKYGSHVVQMCLDKAFDPHLEIIIKELMNHHNFCELCRHPYGNYVIQSSLKAAKGELFELLKERIVRNGHEMNTNMYGKKVLSRLKEIFIRNNLQ